MGKCLKKRYLKQLRQRLYTQSHKVRQMLFAPGVIQYVSIDHKTVSRWGVFVAIAKNKLNGSKL